MNFETFQQSIKATTPPENISLYLLAMWHDANGNWDKAPAMVDNLNDSTACWVHAYLHRKEGDNANANYWYRRANKKIPDMSLQQEWENIVKAIL